MLGLSLKDAGPLSLMVPDATGNLWQISPRLTLRRGEKDEDGCAVRGSEKANSRGIVKTTGCLRNLKPDWPDSYLLK